MARTTKLLEGQKQLRKVYRESDEAISKLHDQEATLRNQIIELEKFIIQTPSRVKQAQEQLVEQAYTIPAPDDWNHDDDDNEDDWAGNGAYIQYVSELEPPQRLMRRQAAELKRQRRNHFFTFVIVACIVASFTVWLWNTLL